MKRRFTLIELLVVIAIIAILATLLISVTRTGLVRVKEAKCVDNFKNIGTASFEFSGDNGGVMPTCTLNAPEANGGSCSDNNSWRFQIGQYIYDSGKDYIRLTESDSALQKGYVSAALCERSQAIKLTPELWEDILMCPLAEDFDSGIGYTFDSLSRENDNGFPDNYYRTGYGFSQSFCATEKMLYQGEMKDRPVGVNISNVEIPSETVMGGDTFYYGAVDLPNGLDTYLRVLSYYDLRNHGDCYNYHKDNTGINVVWADGSARFTDNSILKSGEATHGDVDYYFRVVKP